MQGTSSLSLPVYQSANLLARFNLPICLSPDRPIKIKIKTKSIYQSEIISQSA